MRLVYKDTGVEVKIGDKVKDFRGEPLIVTGWRKPHKPSSSGFVSVVDADEYVDLKEDGRSHGSEFYAGVIGAEWIEREDRGPDW
ncbi:MAG: hypothetical protein P4L79_10120 [Legionella sp.]|uniref:hypothetical protein n=1 Tax=Legionella sp. TaxID=459 RepID=UPI00284773C7|nr:hypothetical protein [Legionella sp.]